MALRKLHLPNWSEGAYAFRLVAAAMLAAFVSHLLPGEHGLSAVISALIVVRPYSQGALKAGAMRLLATAIGIALAFAAVALRRIGLNDYERLFLGLAPLSVLVAYDSNYRSALIAAVLMLAAPVGPAAAVDVAFARATVVGLGAVIGIAVSVLVLPSPHSRVVAAKASHVMTMMIAGLRPTGDREREKADAKMRKALLEMSQMHRDNRKGHRDDDPSGQIIRLVRHAQAVCLLLRSQWRRDEVTRDDFTAALVSLMQARPVDDEAAKAVYRTIPADADHPETWLMRTLAGNVTALARLIAAP